MKIGIFTDPHYKQVDAEVRKHNQSLEKTKKVFEILKKENCSLVICLGDIIDTESKHKVEIENLKTIKKVFDNSGIDIIALMGNHDGFCFTPEEFYETLGEEYKPRTIHMGDKTLIFVDANFFDNGVRYAPGDTEWTNTFVPNINEVREKIEKSLGDTYVFIHQNIDPDILKSHRIANDVEFREVIKESGKVKAVIQGHFHDGKNSCHDGIDYIAVPAMCEHELPYLILEI